jgi:hypothetical protein
MSWVLLTTAPSLPIAEMWREMLAAEGIPALIRPGDAMTSYLGVTAYPCRILVDAGRLDQARQVLDGGDDIETESSPDGSP